MDNGSAEEAKWIADQRSIIEEYVQRQGLGKTIVGADPDWFLPPYVAVWAVHSQKLPGSVGWWGISGDLPTDYVSSANADNAREALAAFSKQWFEISSYLLRDEDHPSMKLGHEANRKELGDLLRRRAEILSGWASDDSVW